MVRAFLPVLLAILAAGCSPRPTTTASRGTAAAVASCRADANRAFIRQNRYLLSERDQTANPYSTSGDTGVTTNGLTQRYDYDTQVADCLAAENVPAAAGSTPPSANTSTSLSH